MNKSIRVVPYVTLSGIIWQIYTNNFSLYIGESRWGKAAAKLGGSSTMCSTAFDVISKRGARRGLGVDLDDEGSPCYQGRISGNQTGSRFGIAEPGRASPLAESRSDSDDLDLDVNLKTRGPI